MSAQFSLSPQFILFVVAGIRRPLHRPVNGFARPIIIDKLEESFDVLYGAA
jgi:hypothetical protein